MTAIARIGCWIFAVAAVLNFAWEMAQMYAFAVPTTLSVQMLAVCGTAALGDAGYTVLVYVVGVWLRLSDWIFRWNFWRVVAVVLISATTAIVLERFALNKALWTYSAGMPRLPILHVGLWPVVQLAVLPLFSLWIVGVLFRPAVMHKP